jgi:CHRD domain
MEIIEQLETFVARLDGFQQVPAIITNGTGAFTATLSSDGKSINYTLTYSDLSSTPHVAHIHVGQAGANGAVIVFLCGGGGKPDCPASGTVKGTLTASDVQAIADQGVVAGSFSDLLVAIGSGVAYVNVHTTNHPGGEIRGQIHTGENEDE